MSPCMPVGLIIRLVKLPLQSGIEKLQSGSFVEGAVKERDKHDASAGIESGYAGVVLSRLVAI